MEPGFRHERFEQWRCERHALAHSVNASTVAPWITMDIDETVSRYLNEVPEARAHAEALTEYLRKRYPLGVHVRSNSIKS